MTGTDIFEVESDLCVVWDCPNRGDRWLELIWKIGPWMVGRDGNGTLVLWVCKQHATEARELGGGSDWMFHAIKDEGGRPILEIAE